MKRKLILGLLTLFMMLLLLPFDGKSVSAAPLTQLKIGNNNDTDLEIDLPEAGNYTYGDDVGEIEFNKPQLDENVYVTWWVYNDNGSYTLTLDQASINTSDSSIIASFGIRAVGDLNLVLLNNNTIRGSSLNVTGSMNSYALYCLGNLTISGTGRLDIESGTSDDWDSVGIYCDGTLTVNSSTICAIANTSTGSGNSKGIYAKTAININGGIIDASGGDVGGQNCSYGMHTLGNINITDGMVGAYGGKSTSSIQNGYNGASYGVYAYNSAYNSEINISGTGMLKGIASDSVQISTGIKAGEITVSGNASLTGVGAVSAYLSPDKSVGIDAYYGFNMNGGTVVAQSVDTEGEAFSFAVPQYGGNYASGGYIILAGSEEASATRASDIFSVYIYNKYVKILPQPTPSVSTISPNSGTIDGGTSVTITGSDFVDITGVSFGSQAATSYNVVSPTELTATAPAAAAGTVDIKVTNATGTSSTVSTDRFTYVDEGIPIVNSLNQVQNVAISNQGLASWSDVTNESGYKISLYKDGIDTKVAINPSANTTQYDLSSIIKNKGTGTYKITVTAIGNNSTYLDGTASVFSDEKIVNQLESATDVKWSGSNTYFKSVTNADSYSIQLYCNNVPVGDPENTNAVGTIEYPFNAAITKNGGGSYTFEVIAKSNNLYVDSYPQKSNAYFVPYPLATPANLALSDIGRASWDPVEHAANYWFYIYKNDQTDYLYCEYLTSSIRNYNMIDFMRSRGVGDYYFMIRALGDYSTYSDSPYSGKSEIRSITKSPQVNGSEITWDGKVAKWTPTGASAYSVQLFLDSKAVDKGIITVYKSQVDNGADFSSKMVSPGAYTVKVTGWGDNYLVLNADTSAASTPYIIATKLDTPINLAWSNNLATWTAVSNAASYDVQLYKDGNPVGEAENVSTNKADFESTLSSSTGGNYTFIVTAKSSSANYSTSAESEPSAAKHVATTLAKVTGVSLTASGVAGWDSVSNASSYLLTLYKDGASYEVIPEDSSTLSVNLLSRMRIGKDGTYTITVQAIGDGTDYASGAVSDLSEGRTVATLTTPSDFSWNGSIATWGAVAHATKYQVKVYKGINSLGTATTTNNYIDSQVIIDNNGIGTYNFTVKAIGDSTLYLDSAVGSDSSAVYINPDTLPTVTEGLVWNGNVAHWTAVSNATSYDVQLYKDSVVVNGALKNVLSANIAGGADFTTEIGASGAGVFTYKVTAKADGIYYVPSLPSAASNNKIVLGKVNNVVLSASGVATWTDLSNETGYVVELYKGGQLLGSGHQLSANTTTYNLLSDMRASGLGEYKVRVTAIISGADNVNGAPSEFSENRSIVRASQVSTITWQGKVAHWSSVGDASYRVQLYKELVVVSGAAITVDEGHVIAGADFTDAIAEGGSGSYTVKITTLGDDLLVMDSQPSMASPEYISPVQLANPTGVTLSGECLASWTTVTNAVSYKLMLSLGNTVVETIPVNALSYDLTSLIGQHGLGTYTVTVQAIGDTGNVHFLNSAISDASGSLTVSKLSTPTGLSWNGSKATWTAVGNATSYEVQLYKDSAAVNGALKSVLSANIAGGADFTAEIGASGAGVFTFKVTAKGDGIIYLPSNASVASGGKIVLAQVSNVALSVSGVATWTDVQNETGYLLQLYKGVEAVGNAIEVTAGTVSYDYLSVMRDTGVGSYTVSITAKGDVPNYSNGSASSKSNAVSISKLQKASNLNWNEKATSFSVITNATSYEIQLYKDGQAIGLVKTLAAAQLSEGFDFSTEIANAGGGIYTYTVKAIGNGILYLDGDVSLVSSEKIMAIKLGSVTNIEFSDHGVATWSGISHAASYQVKLYKDHTLLTPATVTVGAGTTSTDFLDTMREAGAGEYYVTVTANGDGTYYSNSDASTDSTSQSIIKLDQADNLTWSNHIVHWEAVSGAACYVVQLYKDGDAHGFSVTVNPANLNGGVNFHSAIAAEGAGKYTFSVTTIGNEILLLNSDPKNSSVNIVSPYPATATFDKYTASNQYKDITVSLALSEDTLLSVKNAANELVNNTDYILTGNTLTINKNYLAAQPAGTVTLSLTFEVAAEQSLVITINNSQPAPSTGNTVAPPVGTNLGEGKRTVTVITGDKDKAAVEVQIQRKTDASGSTTDSITLGQEEASKTIEQAVKNQSSMATINLKSDDKSKADLTEVDITKDLTQMFGQNEIGLNIAANEVSMVLPTETIAELDEDVKITIKKLTSKDEIDASNGFMLSMSAGSTMIGSPVSIETNYAKKTMLTLPIDSVQVPTDKEQLEAFINSLAVLVQHSDGEVVLQKGTIAYDKDGRPVSITITVDKFSTFTVIHTNYTVKNTVVRAKQMPDKTWTLKYKEELDASTVNAETIYVLDSKGNKVDVTLKYSNNRLIIVPKEPYKTKQTYTLCVTSEVKYQSGKSLEEGRKYQFTICSTSLDNTTISSYSKIAAKKVWNINLKKTIAAKAFGKKNIIVVDNNGDAVKVKISIKVDHYVSVTPLKPYGSGKTYYIIIKGVKFEDGTSMTQNQGIKFSVK